MRLTIRYFASVREALGSAETLDVDAPLTVGQLRERLIARGPAHAQALAYARPLRAAVNQVMADESQWLQADAEVAWFPPVTGG